MPSVGDVYRISCIFSTVNAEPVINTFYYRISATGTGDEKAALHLGFATTVSTQYAACLPTNLTGIQDNVQPVKPIGTVEVTTSAVTAGSVAGHVMPSQCSVILTRKTATPGKGGRGRIFIGPIPLANVNSLDDNKVQVTAYQNLATQLALGFTATGWSFLPCLWKRKTLTSLDLTSVGLNTLIKTRRSRVEGTRFHRRKKHTVGSI